MTVDGTYTYDGDGKRVKKSNGKIYWYGLNGEVLAESGLSGAITSGAADCPDRSV